MPDLLFDRLRAALGELWRLVEERRNGEEELLLSATREEKNARDAGKKARQALADNHASELAALAAAAHEEQEGLQSRLTADEQEAQRALTSDRQKLEAEERAERTRIEASLKDALWLADSVSESGRRTLQEELDAAKNQETSGETRIEALWQEVEPLLNRIGLEREDVEPEEKLPKIKGDKAAEHVALLTEAAHLVGDMRRSSLLGWLRWPVLAVFAVLGWGAVTAPALWLRPQYPWLLGGIMSGLLAALAVREAVLFLARRKLRPLAERFAIAATRVHDLGTHLVGGIEASAAARRTGFLNQQVADRRNAQAAHKPQLEELSRRARAEHASLEQRFLARSAAHRQLAQQTLESTQLRHQETRAHCVARQKKEQQDAEAAHAERLRLLEQTRLQKTKQLRQQWKTGAAGLLTTFHELQQLGVSRRSDDSKTASAALSAELPFGTICVDPKQLAGTMPLEMLSPLPSAPLHLPAFLPFPRLGGLMLQAFGGGRTVAIQTLQALMLRFLTALPPGKVRLTILDPVGLGENFSAFMHLADHDEALVTSRIWTEPAHIEKQLADLTTHMENVIQKYLRSQFKSIEDYNAQAGEVAEPYRVLVVANFPVNFTPQAARRLVSIVQSGSSCGVYALISFDTRQPLPQGFQLEDLEQLCLNLFWSQERFRWGDGTLDRFPLELETPPAAHSIIETVGRVGALSRDANRVRVPFSFIAPSASEFWKGDSRRGLTVPLGRSGAVRRLSLRLGQGTSQHVLVAGKTGSGKSTLWHALITNLALLYSPDEVELYLIDFKKGVEFKTYANHQLPHARVIAVESEREFGLSVLQRLDAELRQRGDLFRAAGVNDVASYREAHPDAVCPRILLIVDEFQEFFVEDDRLSQESALLLDRLVRQGRAFGLHILFGSQTLGGAYSLARSTIDQMAVRIALQCSEADAQLILDKDNSAARLLSRPGEAIYNDTNGSLEGNEVFQVVWLPDDQRDEALETVHRLVAQRLPAAAPRLPLVFEGNTPAELAHNPLLARLLVRAGSVSDGLVSVAHASGPAQAWLGDAIAIKEPTAAVFRPQSSHNLLIVGQDDDAALALLTSALVSLAVQQPTARFVILDGTAAHEPRAPYLKEAADGWPHPVILVERAELTTALATLAEEMNQRLKGASTDPSVRYVLINGLQRYREFRRSDDDLGFGRRGAERSISPLEHLQALLRDGPGVKIHLLIWCDSLANVMRALDRAGLRECGQRVVFQMSAADSSHLLDSPLASRLGRNRALYFTDEMAHAEKFRPYGLPSLTWIAEVKQRVGQTK